MDFDRFNMINLGLSTWTTWSECSKTCGNGNKTRERQCMSGTCSITSLAELTETEACYEEDCKLSLQEYYMVNIILSLYNLFRLDAMDNLVGMQ